MNVIGGALLREEQRLASSPGGPAWRSFQGGLAAFADGPQTRTFDGGSVCVVADCDLLDLITLADLAGVADEAQIIATLWRKDGERLVDRLKGAFAFAVWDADRRELLLATDRLGIKRLYHAAGPGGIGFATRPGVLPDVAGLVRHVDPLAVYHYLNFGFVPAPYSIYAGVRRLSPGEVLRVRNGAESRRRYWDLQYTERPQSLDVAGAEMRRLLGLAVTRALAGTTPKETGAFLSGGTDSSTVVGLMTEATGERANAFSIGFQEERYNELRYADIAARRFDASHHTAIVTADEAFGVLPRLVEAYDEPYGNDSTIPTYFCAALARSHGIDWLLAGDGGDELFGGNERYRVHQIFALYGRLPRWFRRSMVEPVLSALPDGGTSTLGRAQRYVRRAQMPAVRRFFHYEFFVAQEAPSVLTPEFLRAIDPEAPWALAEEHFGRAVARSELNRLLYLDVKLTIGDNDLYKVTRTADVAGVTVRFPMLDEAVAEFTGTLPARYKVRGLEKRYLFKHALRTLLPPEILRKPKHGFGLPVSDWLRSHRGFRDLARETLLSPRFVDLGYVRRDALERVFALHESDTTTYYGTILWTLLMFALWHRRHVGGGAP